jgi:fatty-acyl-CoA synthase
MPSTMMDRPLLISAILWRAEKLYGYRDVVTQRESGDPWRSNYGEVAARSRKLASALEKAGIKAGDRVATFGWNTQTHLECYFAIPSMGAVLHTINVRLFHDQLEYIINHAQDQIVFCDRSVFPVFEQLAGKVPSVRLVVLMNECPDPLPESRAFQTVDYEDFLNSGSESFDWPDFDERTAAGMCYTSGTTGNPKGVVYSHRSTFLHSLVAGLPNSAGIGEHDSVMYAVPMFHANAWGLPYSCSLGGAAQVMSDRYLDPQRVVTLLENEGVTVSAGVPTIWIGVLALLEASGRSLPKLQRVLCGGSAAPPALIDGLRKHGIELIHAWGMTETSPLGSLTRVPSFLAEATEGERNKARYKQGQIVPTIECRIVDVEAARELPWDGVAFGELQVRGPYITGDYYNDPQSGEKFADGWLRTGDVATIDEHGFIQLVDRTKDLVKSGGEWISSVELENHIMAHPKVLEAAVVGLPHPKWDERPVAAVVLRPEQSATPDEIKAFLSDKVAKWWLPDEVLFVESLPKTSVGKFAKNHLRDQLGEVVKRWAAAGG